MATPESTSAFIRVPKAARSPAAMPATEAAASSTACFISAAVAAQWYSPVTARATAQSVRDTYLPSTSPRPLAAR